MMSTVSLTEAALLRAALASIQLDYETQTEPIVSDATRYRLTLAARAFVAALDAEAAEEAPAQIQFRPVPDTVQPTGPRIPGYKTTNVAAPPPGREQRP